MGDINCSHWVFYHWFQHKQSEVYAKQIWKSQPELSCQSGSLVSFSSRALKNLTKQIETWLSPHPNSADNWISAVRGSHLQLCTQLHCVKMSNRIFATGINILETLQGICIPEFLRVLFFATQGRFLRNKTQTVSLIMRSKISAVHSWSFLRGRKTGERITEHLKNYIKSVGLPHLAPAKYTKHRLTMLGITTKQEKSNIILFVISHAKLPSGKTFVDRKTWWITKMPKRLQGPIQFFKN